MEFVRNKWNVLNVKTPTVGLRKRDELREPITKDNQLGLAVLREFAQFLTDWQEEGTTEYTQETFLVTRHTCLAAADAAEYLLE